MDPRLSWEGVEAMVAEGRRELEAQVTVRLATPEDAPHIDRLAALESAPVPTGPVLVAVVDDELVAALPLRRGRALADPFRPTEGPVRLLERREAQLRSRGPRPRRRRPA